MSDRPTIEDVLDVPRTIVAIMLTDLQTATEDGPIRSEDGALVVHRADPELAGEILALLEPQRPHICTSCDGIGWVDDEGWDRYEFGLPGKERVEASGLIPCGRCNFGNWSTYRDEFTEPTTVTDGWTREQEARVVEILELCAAALVAGDPEGES